MGNYLYMYKVIFEVPEQENVETYFKNIPTIDNVSDMLSKGQMHYKLMEGCQKLAVWVLSMYDYNNDYPLIRNCEWQSRHTPKDKVGSLVVQKIRLWDYENT